MDPQRRLVDLKTPERSTHHVPEELNKKSPHDAVSHPQHKDEDQVGGLTKPVERFDPAKATMTRGNFGEIVGDEDGQTPFELLRDKNLRNDVSDLLLRRPGMDVHLSAVRARWRETEDP